MQFPKFPFYLRPKGRPAAATGGGGGGDVTSVNSQTGAVVITAAGIGAASDAALTAGLATKADDAATTAALATKAGATATTAALATKANDSATTAALALKAPLVSPALTGTPIAPTASASTDTTQIATTAFVRAEIASVVAAAPGTLDTLNELAAALGDDANFVTTMVAALALKAPLASPSLTGTPTAPTASAATNTTQLATTAFVKAAITALIDGAPGALDTLKELADSLADDADFAATMVTALATKQPATVVSTWAARGSGSTVGQSKLISDIGGAAGTTVRWDGTYWRVTAPTFFVFDLTLNTEGAVTTDVILKQATLPAGLLRLGRVVQFFVQFAKNNTSAALNDVSILLGPLGTMADPAIVSSAQFIAANRSYGVNPMMTVIDATTLRSLGRQDAISDFTGLAITSPYPKNVTISDLDANALVLSASVRSASTATAGQVAHMLMEISP